MYNWRKMCSNTSGFNVLHDELRRGGGKYILEDVQMPESCGSRVCTIVFKYYGEDFIVMTCLDSPIPYSGTNKRIENWLESGIVEFESFVQLTDFLSQFGTETTGYRNDSGNREGCTYNDPEEDLRPERPLMEYDRDSLTVPKGKKTYAVIDKERLELDLKNEIFGQDENIKKIAHLIRNHIGTKNKIRPLSVFLYGPPGTGKSKIAELVTEKLNQQLAPDEQFYYRPVDCAQFQEKSDISRMIGSAPGYVGFNEPSVFSVLEDHKNTVFVFEEIEKADGNVTEVIMQAMETGRQDTNGKTLRNGRSYYDLSHAVIFFTSNIDISEKKKVGFVNDPCEEQVVLSDDKSLNIARVVSEETKEAKKRLLESGEFRREVISRMNAIIKFNVLSGDSIKDIAAKSIRDSADAYRLYITKIETSVLQEFINNTAGETEDFGARELRTEASNYFGDALLEYSLTHDDYSKVIITGTLDNIEVIPG